MTPLPTRIASERTASYSGGQTHREEFDPANLAVDRDHLHLPIAVDPKLAAAVAAGREKTLEADSDQECPAAARAIDRMVQRRRRLPPQSLFLRPCWLARRRFVRRK